MPTLNGIEQGCRLTVWLPVNAETGETDTDTLDGRETADWDHGYYYCPRATRTSIILSKSEKKQKPTHNKRDEPDGLLWPNLRGGTSASAN
jgi:hypothetical protein